MLITAGEIIKQSWVNYKKCWRKFLPYMISLLLPTVILSALSVISLYLQVYIPSSSFISSIIIILVFAAGMVFLLWASISLAKELKNCVTGQEQHWKSVFSESHGLIWPVIYTSILASLIVLGGTILLVIPGIIFSLWYGFAFYAVVFEDKKGFNALKASKELVVGRWWAIFWRALAPGFVFVIISVALNYGIGFLVGRLETAGIFGKLGSVLLFNILNSSASVLIAPMTALASVLLYLSAKETRTSPTNS
ncbi:MAG: hypothetical protein AAB348_02505 [Patescibacteria group bacterium]